MKWRLLVVGILFVTASTVISSERAESAGIRVPERLEYQLLWNGIHAGTSTLSITGSKGVFHITSTAKSSDFISLFYEVSDTVESLCRNDSFIPINYTLKLKEGSHKKQKEVQFFMNSSGNAIYMDHLKNERREIELPGAVMDPLASFYFLRTLPLEVGKSVFLKIFDSKKVWNVEVQVLRKEKVSSWLGTYDTILVRPKLESEGIFMRKGDIYIWLSDDEKRIPVQLKTEVKVGSVRAILRKIN
jgi:hypothetical protein